MGYTMNSRTKVCVRGIIKKDTPTLDNLDRINIEGMSLSDLISRLYNLKGRTILNNNKKFNQVMTTKVKEIIAYITIPELNELLNNIFQNDSESKENRKAIFQKVLEKSKEA